uniref:Putative secreted protein n=1 Tax=Ixodes scapularis TaxID=6945 RepID=A0A4D5S076_IXOSC
MSCPLQPCSVCLLVASAMLLGRFGSAHKKGGASRGLHPQDLHQSARVTRQLSAPLSSPALHTFWLRTCGHPKQEAQAQGQVSRNCKES